MRGAATKAMSDIVEERQQSRCPPAAAPLRAAARRPAGFVARSSHTAPGIARRSRLASGPGGLQQKCEVISARALRSTWWTQSSQIGQVLYHGRDGHATKPSWHGRLAREMTGLTRYEPGFSQERQIS